MSSFPFKFIILNTIIAVISRRLLSNHDVMIEPERNENDNNNQSNIADLPSITMETWIAQWIHPKSPEYQTISPFKPLPPSEAQRHSLLNNQQSAHSFTEIDFLELPDETHADQKEERFKGFCLNIARCCPTEIVAMCIPVIVVFVLVVLHLHHYK